MAVRLSHSNYCLNLYANGFTATYWDYYNKNNSTIVKKFMVHTLLHECDALATAFRHFPEARESKTLEELAIALWEL